MTQLLVGTKKGLFVLEGEPGKTFEVTSRAFAGEPIEFAMRDPRTGRTFAAVTSAFYGPKIFYSDDLAGEWQQAEGLELPEDAETPLERLWSIVPAEDDGHLYAGGAPGVLFESHDSGATWELNKAFWEQPTRPDWSPGAGGMCMHSIATWPGDPKRVAIAISAVGVWLTEDGGETWRHGNKGLYPRYMPDEAREDTIDLCVHNMHRHPKQPDRLFMQFHGGVYRSLMACTDCCVAAWMPVICWPISPVAFAVCSASAFTSEATTAKPRPASPARAASMVAFSASRLVCPAMVLIS